MAGKRNPFRRIRLVYRRSKPLTKMAVAVVIVLSMAAMLSLNAAKRDAAAQLKALQAQAAALEQEAAKLKQDMSILGTPESVEQIARDELNMVDPDTVIFRPEQ